MASQIKKISSKKNQNEVPDEEFDETEDESDELAAGTTIKRVRRKKKQQPEKQHSIAEEVRRGIAGVACVGIAVFFVLAGFNKAGNLGATLFNGLTYLFGLGYGLVPFSFILWAVTLFRSIDKKVGFWKWFGSILFFAASLALIDVSLPGRGGVVGALITHPLIYAIDVVATVVTLMTMQVIALMLILNTSFKMPTWMTRAEEAIEEEIEPIISTPLTEEAEDLNEEIPEEKPEEKKPAKGILAKLTQSGDEPSIALPNVLGKAYVPPPLSLLEKNKGRPSVGDVKANTNIIKRTLLNFGIDVEMDEVSIGPSVTRYALKPAEGVRLSRIVALQSNLELALAASPVRIEAPIPGKALVGVEVPNQTRTMLGMGTILANDEFNDKKKPLMIALGSDISGIPHYANLAKMPHVLIAGATGSGKSVTIHDLIVSLLYRCGPDQLRFVMIDPKRVELTMYNDIPHLLTPVITDPKKAILSLKWLTKEMDRRYSVLETESVRDISSYHTTVLKPALEAFAKEQTKITVNGQDETKKQLPEPMPYIVVVLDELADLMQTYPRELEASIVRLAQMSRAVGIHLVLSTQRPSVKVITGLIKANIPARIALQVASQIDSRTILDMGGAENLLGAGDMLYLSGEMSKPVRIQAPYISETELKGIVKFLKEQFEGQLPNDIALTFGQEPNPQDAGGFGGIPESALSGGFSEGEGDEDDMYEEAKAAVLEAGKASTSYLQRKLRVGYSRAARLMDILEQRGVIGPADGAKPREVLGRNESTSASSLDSTDADDTV
jgi:S-DNA-T family DNA segregation ATPase FtsK/SpoIIIE